MEEPGAFEGSLHGAAVTTDAAHSSNGTAHITQDPEKGKRRNVVHGRNIFHINHRGLSWIALAARGS